MSRWGRGSGRACGVGARAVARACAPACPPSTRKRLVIAAGDISGAQGGRPRPRAPSLSPIAAAPSPPAPHPPSLQDRFEAALESHRTLWLADFDARKAAFEADFAARKAALEAELQEKVREKKAIKNMFVTLVFVLRLLA